MAKMSRYRRGAVVAMAGLAMVAVQSPALGQEAPRVTSDVRVSDDDLSPVRTYTSPQILIHPDDPNIAVASAVEMRSRVCHLFRSNDAGRNWTLLDAVPSPEEFPFCFNTSGTTTQSPIAWGRDATLYYGMVGWGGQESAGEGSERSGVRGNLSVILARSTDLGDSWQTTVVRDAREFMGAEIENNRPVSSVAVDTSGDQDVVYVGWRRSLPEAEDAPRLPQVAVSTDGGQSFGEPINPLADYFAGMDGAEELGGGQPSLAVADDGTLYVLSSAENPGEDANSSLVVAKSADQGKTFTVAEASPPSAYHTDELLAWSPEGGSEGTLHMVYEDKVDPPPGAGERDIYYRRSLDGGQTFGEAVMINDDDPSKFYVQVTPNVNVAPDGRVGLAWWDFRNDPGLFVNDVYYAYSTDNGATWSENVRISDRSSNRKIGTWSNGFDMRAPVGLGATDAFTLVGWEDTRLGDNVTQIQDIFASAVQFEPLQRGTSDALRYTVAGLVGLTLAGLALLAASVLRRRPTAGAR